MLDLIPLNLKLTFVLPWIYHLFLFLDKCLLFQSSIVFLGTLSINDYQKESRLGSLFDRQTTRMTSILQFNTTTAFHQPIIGHIDINK